MVSGCPQSVVLQLLSAMSEVDAYYDFNKFLLSLVGLWPYSRSKLLFVKKTLTNLLIASVLIPQWLVLTRPDLTIPCVLKNLSSSMMCLGAILKHTVAWYQTEVFKEFLNQVKHDWKVNQGEKLKILKNHAALGKYYGKLLSSLIYPSALILVIVDTVDLIAVIIVPENATYTSHFPVETEYMIDEQVYYFPIILHRCLAVLAIATIYSSSESLYFMLLQHVASLFSIASYCITKSIATESDHIEDNTGSVSRSSRETFVEGICQHKRAMQFFEILREKIAVSYGPLIILGVISLSGNLYSLSMTIRDVSKIQESLSSLIFVCGELAYMYYANYMVQQLLDSIDNVVPFIYSTNWYDTSIILQKFLLLVMLQGSKEYSFTFFGFYCASTEGFADLLKKSVSGVTMMASLQ